MSERATISDAAFIIDRRRVKVKERSDDRHHSHTTLGHSKRIRVCPDRFPIADDMRREVLRRGNFLRDEDTPQVGIIGAMVPARRSSGGGVARSAPAAYASGAARDSR